MRLFLTALLLSLFVLISFGQNNIDLHFPQEPTVFTQVMEDLENELITQEQAVLYILQSVRAHDRLPKRYIDLPMERSQTIPMREVYIMMSNMAEPPEDGEISELLSRPSLTHTHTTANFDIHYNAGTSPSQVATYAEDSYAYIHDVLNYLTPPSDGGAGGSPRYDIYIMSLSPGVLGYCSPEASGPNPWPDATSYIVIATAALGYGLDYIKATTIHEYFHATQFAYDAMDSDRFYYETSSVWIERERFPEVHLHGSHLSIFFNNPHMSLRTYNGANEYGSFPFNSYVSENYGRDAIRTIWEETRFSSMLNSFQTVFMSHGSSRTQAMSDFWEWNYFTGPRATPHGQYDDAALYPAVSITATHSAYPANGNATGIHNFGCRYIRFNVPPGASGPFSLIFDGASSAIWNAQLLLVGAASYTKHNIALNAHGYGVLELDESDYEDINEIILIGGVVSSHGTSWSYNYTAQFAEVDPTYNPPRNLVAHSDYDGFVPLEWDNPFGASIGGREIIGYDDGTPAGTLPMAEHGIVFEGLSFEIMAPCTLKEVIMVANANGNLTVRVYADDGSGFADTGTEFINFSATTEANTWTTTEIPGGGIYLDAGSYFIGYDRTAEAHAVYIDASGESERSAVQTAGGWGIPPGDYLLRIGVQNIGSTGGLTGFHVYRSGTSGGPYTFVDVATTTAYIDSTVENDTPYYYVVRAQYGSHESPNSNQAMAVPSEGSTEEGLLYECEFTAERFYRFGTGNAAAQEFSIDRPVQITQLWYLTTGTGYFFPTIHPYSSDRVQRNILPRFAWGVDSTMWQVIDITDYRIIVNDNFLVAFEWHDTSVYLGYASATSANCWNNFGIWARQETLQYSIMCVVREIDTTDNYVLEGIVNLGLGSGGSVGEDDLSGSIVSILGTDMQDTTDADGRYRIEDIPPGHARIRASHSGYEAQMMDIGFESDIMQDFSLLPMNIPRNPPQELAALSYHDGVVPLYWTVPMGAPGTMEEIYYFDEPATWYYGAVGRDDVQVQHFTTYFPCSLQYAAIVFYDSAGIYRDVHIQVFEDDGEGYPDLSSPISDRITMTPRGYPNWDIIDMRDLEITLEAGQDFHIGVINTANHSFVVADSNASTMPSRSKIFWSSESAWSDSIQDFYFSAVVKYTGFSGIEIIDDSPRGPLRDGFVAEKSRVEGPVRSFLGVLGSTDFEETTTFETMRGYHIYRSDERDGDYEHIYTATTDTFNFMDETVDNATRYWYKIATMYFHGESDYTGPVTALPMQWRDTAQVLVVDDDGSSYIRGAVDVFDPYRFALDELGITYNVLEPCCTIGTPGPSAALMSEYEAVLWFTGKGNRDGWTISEDDEAEIATYLDDGGAIAIFSSGYVRDRYDGAVHFLDYFINERLGITRYIHDNWVIFDGGPSYIANGMEGGFAEGLSFNLTAEYYTPDSIKVDFIREHSMQDVLGMQVGTENRTCAIANYTGDKIFFSSLPLEALTDGSDPNTRTEFMRRLFYDYLWAILGDTVVTFDMEVERGWNMLSIPVELTDNTVNDVFPGFVGAVYTFNPTTGVYDEVDTVVAGKGYFVLFSAATTIPLTGMPVNFFSSPIYRGWNMIGAVYNPDSVGFGDVRLGPGASMVGDQYVYSPSTGTYNATDYLVRGKATWVLIDENTFISVPDVDGYFKSAVPMPEVEFEMDIDNHSFKFGITAAETYANCLPPAAPYSRTITPAYIDYNGFKAKELYNNSGQFNLTVDVGGVARFEIPEGYMVSIGNDNVSGIAEIYLSKGNHEVYLHRAPESFAIVEINPNPFNPATSIDFTIPRQSEVEISIFDTDGRLVENLVNETYPVGRHSVIWDASGKSTGVYIVKVQTESKVLTERMLFIK